MKISDLKVIRIRLLDFGKVKASVDVQVGEIFIIRGLALIQGEDNLFIGTPKRKGADGKFYDAGFSWIWKDKKVTETSDKFRKVLESIILKAYETEKAKAPKKSTKAEPIETDIDEDLPF